MGTTKEPFNFPGRCYEGLLFWMSTWKSKKFEDFYWSNNLNDRVVLYNCFNRLFCVTINLILGFGTVGVRLYGGMQQVLTLHRMGKSQYTLVLVLSQDFPQQYWTRLWSTWLTLIVIWSLPSSFLKTVVLSQSYYLAFEN